MHPRQRPLPPEIEQTWLAALGNAEIDPDEALLYVLDGDKGSNGYGARYLHRGLHINAEGEADEIHPLLNEMNEDDCIDAYRIVVFRDRTLEGTAALARHELEHARQRDIHGQKLMELYGIAEQVILERVGGLPGSGFLYQVIPVEMDANAAAAVFVRDRFGAERIEELLRSGDKDGSAFRSLVGPPPIETLPERMIRFFATMPDLCELFAGAQQPPVHDAARRPRLARRRRRLRATSARRAAEVAPLGDADTHPILTRVSPGPFRKSEQLDHFP